MANEKDILGVDLEVGNQSPANQAIDSFYAKIVKTNDAINQLGANATFGQAIGSELVDVQNRAVAVQRTFQSFGRFPTTGIDGITQASVRLQKESILVQRRLQEIRSTSIAGKDANFIQSLGNDAIVAERRLASLERAAARIETRRPAGSGNAALSSFQKQNLTYQANDVITGLLSGQNVTQIAAQQGGQIAQIFSPTQAAALVAAYAPLVTILAAGTAAIAATYFYTKSIRDEAERRLKVEEKINSAINNQILSQQRGIENAQKERERAKFDRAFERSVSGDTIENLIERRRRAEQILTLTPASLPVIENGKVVQKDNENFQRQVEQLKRLDLEIEKVQNKTITFNSGTIFQDIIRIEQEAEKRRAEQAAKLQRLTKEAREKIQAEIKETSTFIFGLFENTNDNRFAKIFLDGEKAINAARIATRNLSDDQKQLALTLVKNQNALSLFNARLDSRLAASDLQDQADQFRNAGRRAFQNVNEFNAFRDRQIQLLAQGDTIGVNGASLLSQNRAFNFSDQQRESLISFIARQQVQFQNNGTENLDLNQRLQRQIDIITKLNPANDAERAAADRKIIALTDSLDPNKLNANLRDLAAASREREAARTLNGERAGLEIARAALDENKKAATTLEKLLKIAESEGLTGVLRIINDAKDQAEITTTQRINESATKKLME